MVPCSIAPRSPSMHLECFLLSYRTSLATLLNIPNSSPTFCHLYAINKPLACSATHALNRLPLTILQGKIWKLTLICHQVHLKVGFILFNSRMNAFNTWLLTFLTPPQYHLFMIWLGCSDRGMTILQTGTGLLLCAFEANASRLYIGQLYTDIEKRSSGMVSNNAGLNGRFAVLFLSCSLLMGSRWYSHLSRNIEHSVQRLSGQNTHTTANHFPLPRFWIKWR